MQNDIEKRIIELMKKDNRRDFTVPEIMKELTITNRESVVAAVARLEGSKDIEESRRKGRTRYYRLKQ